MITPINTTIIVSRYDEDVTWTIPLVEHGFRVIVYDHVPRPNNPYFVPYNEGREASAYFKFLLDNYHNLTTYTIFLHGTDTSWHHKGSLTNTILNMYKRKYKPKHYESLNHICLGGINNTIVKHSNYFFDKFLAPYVGDRKRFFGDWTPGNVCCAQFVVHKSRILKYPHKFYFDIYQWLLTSKRMNHKDKGHMLEWTWFIIFDNPNPKRDPNHLKKREPVVAQGVHASCKSSQTKLN